MTDSAMVAGANNGKATARRYRWTSALILTLLAGCGGGGGGSGGSSPPAPPSTATVAVAVGGLRTGQQITLANNGGDNLTITSNGTFTFPRAIATSGSYAVTIVSAPSAETCTLKDSTGALQSQSSVTVTMSCGPTILHNFNGPEGYSDGAKTFTQSPNLLVASDGNIYGTVVYGGTYGFGTIFRMTPAGDLTVLHHFADGNADGKNPQAALVEGPGGDLYGTTEQGGVDGVGTIFKISRSGTFTLLHSFSTSDGAFPKAALVQDGGDFYGTTMTGGIFNRGTVFKFASSGKISLLYSFNSADGDLPSAPLIQSSDGNFYGTTSQGGANGGGRVFKITRSGVLTPLHDFNGTDGSYLYGPIIRDANNNVYGSVYSANPGKTTITAGNVFKISPSGDYTVLHQFMGPDGGAPAGGLIWGIDGNIYGTTSGGGEGMPDAAGTIFRLSPSGDFSLLYTFKGGLALFSPTGTAPRAALVQDRSGIIYGTTSYGGTYNRGLIFKF